MIRTAYSHLCKWCAYSYIFKVFSIFINDKHISVQIQSGKRIALLGLFCPFFWYALLTGAPKLELMFHATHSGIVFLIGIAIICVSLRKQKKQ